MRRLRDTRITRFLVATGVIGLTVALTVVALAGDSQKRDKAAPDGTVETFERNLGGALPPEEGTPPTGTPESSGPESKAGYTIDWYTVTNNGGTNTAASTNYSWDATVGQGLAGSSASTSWSWDVGFWFSDAVGGACLAALAGDVNLTGSVNSTDIIVLVNYVLKAGPLPEPCEANGDVNCNGGVNSTDIIYLVNYVLKAGPLPCDICNDSPLPCT